MPAETTLLTAYEITLRGAIPAKKNERKLVRIKGRMAMAHNREVRDQIHSLTLQARVQWGHKPPLEHPEIWVYLTLPRFGADQDNAYTTILDVLQDAGVLKNDNVRRCNGWKHLAPVVKGPAGARILIRPQQGVMEVE